MSQLSKKLTHHPHLDTVSLETQRLILKTANGELAAPYLDFLIVNKVFFHDWSPARDEEYYTLERQEEEMRTNNGLMQEENAIRFYLSPKEKPHKIIGDMGFMNIVKGGFLSCHLGYRMDEQHTNQGYMEEALREAILFIFNKVKLHRIEANIMPHNKPSIRLVEKLGFEHEGLAKKYLKINGKWKDHIHYVLLNEALENSI